MSSPQTPIPSTSGVLSSLPAANRSPVRLGLAAWIALVSVLIAAAIGVIPRWRHASALKQETSDLAVPSVVVTYPSPGKASAGLSLPAEVRPLIEAPIYARANGYVKKWLVDIGATVEAGQLLAEIDTPELNQELARSRAELAQADAALGLAKITAARWADLLKTSSVSEQEAAEKQSDLALKTANLQAAAANVHRLEELQGFAHVTAPFAGTITARKTDVGELIVAGSAKELFRLAQTGTLRVYVHVPESLARAVEPGQMAEMTVPQMPGRPIAAKVVRTAGAVDVVSRTLLTELEVNNSSGQLLAGTYAEVRFPEAKIDAPMTLSGSTLLFRAEGPQVGVVLPDNTVQLRNLSLGRDFGPTIEVLGGVSPTDRVIVNPPDALANGDKVRVSENEKAPALANATDKAGLSKQ